jgi:hypothetical protein
MILMQELLEIHLPPLSKVLIEHIISYGILVAKSTSFISNNKYRRYGMLDRTS